MEHLQELRLKHNEILSTLFQEGILDSRYSAFKEADVEDHKFTHQTIIQFFQDAEKALYETRRTVNRHGVLDQRKMEIELLQIKGASSYIGIARVVNACQALHDACTANDRRRCLGRIQKLQEEYDLAKHHLEDLMELENEIWAVGGKLF